MDFQRLPPTYRLELANEVIDKLSEGIPLAQICRDNPKMPTSRTVYNWRNAVPDFRKRWDDAKLVIFDAIAERLRMTARGAPPEHGGDSTGDIQRDKLIIDVDFKLLSKWDPLRYGDRSTLNHEGDVGVNVSKTNKDRARALAALLAKTKTEKP